MEILNFASREGSPQRRKNFRAVFGVCLLVSAIALGSTLAANININSGPVEFGQGVAQTTTCDSQITVTPGSSFDNSATPSPIPTPSDATGVFQLGTISVSDIDVACDGKIFTIKAYAQSDSTPLELLSGVSEIVIQDTGNDFSAVTGGISVDASDGSAFTVTILVPTLNSSEVYKVTIESGDTVTSYYPSGPQLNVPLSQLTAAGWTPCFENNYTDTTTPVSDALNNCTEPYLAVFGREVGGDTALLLAAAPRADVFTVTAGYSPHLANGTYWYYTPFMDGGAQSLGFSPDGVINQYTCDFQQEVGDPTSPYRLCWHISGDVEPTFDHGYRLGIEYSPDVYSGGYLRDIYQHN